MWAYGMVIYCILNPDAKFPFYFDAKEARESWVGPERFDVLAFLEENIAKQKKPKHSSKYHHLRQTREWRTLADIYEICTAFHPTERPTATQVVSTLTELKHFNIIPLAVSQNSALERFDRSVAAGLESNALIIQEDQVDNAINACSFICVTLGHLLLSEKNDIIATGTTLQDTIVNVAERTIRDFPQHFNAYRNLEQRYDVQEAYAILRKASVVADAYDLSEEIMPTNCVYSADGKKELADALEKLKMQSTSNVSVAIYTCGIYVLLVGYVGEKVFLVDSHPVVEDSQGKQTGVAIVSDGITTQSSFLLNWLSTRLKKSGVPKGSVQSFSIMM
jgi:hypothetical protein